MSNNSDTNTTKIPVWSGKKEEFHMWFMQFMAHAAVHGYAELLVEEKHDDLPDSNKESATDTEVHKKMRRKHTVAMCHLASAMGNKAENMLFIMKTANKDWPTGQIHLTIKALMKKKVPGTLHLMLN